MEAENEIGLRDFFLILKKRRKLIILITFIVVTTVGLLTYFVIPSTYEAKVSIIVGRSESEKDSNKDNYTDVVMYQNLIKTYSEIAKSEVVAKGTLKVLDNKISLDEIKKSITVTPLQDTQIIYIKVQSYEAKETYDIASALSKVFIEEASQRINLGSIQILDEPVLPKNPIKPKKILDIIIAFIIGFLGSVALAFMIEYLDNTVKNEQDIVKCIGIPVIGTIPKYTKNKGEN